MFSLKKFEDSGEPPINNDENKRAVSQISQIQVPIKS